MSQALTLPAVSAAGSIDSYIQAVRRFPMLSAEEECRLATRFRERRAAVAACVQTVPGGRIGQGRSTYAVRSPI